MYSLISGTQQSFCHFDQKMQPQQRSTVEQRLIFPLRFALRTFRAKSCTLANCDRRWKAQLICRTLRSQFAQFSWQPIACQAHFSCFASPGSPWMMQEFSVSTSINVAVKFCSPRWVSLGGARCRASWRIDRLRVRVGMPSTLKWWKGKLISWARGHVFILLYAVSGVHAFDGVSANATRLRKKV